MDGSQAGAHLALIEKLRRRSSNICLYGLAPPKLATEPARLREIVAQQEARLSALKPDGVIIYDIQNESGRNGEPRPFPFLPTVDPDLYARSHLAGVGLPQIVYRCVGNTSAPAFGGWLDEVAREEMPRLAVLVGAPSALQRPPGLGLAEAYRMVQERCPRLVLGGIAIAERHGRKANEHEQLIAKMAQGCQFFVTQAIYDASSSKSLLSDYALRLNADGQSPVPIILTFAPCGSVKTLELMKWLGISFPRWLENELKHSGDVLARSLRLCEQVFEDIWDYAQEKKLPLGINVESISIRKTEVDASVELFRVLRAKLQRS